MPRADQLDAYFKGKRYWLTPDGEWIDCNSGMGHLKACYQYVKEHGIEVKGSDWANVLYEAGFVRVVILGSTLHCEFYKPLTKAQVSSLKEYAFDHDLILFNDRLDGDFQPSV